MTSTRLAVGDPAPDFTLVDQNGNHVALTDLTATKRVALVFYPFAFSGICTGELDEVRDELERWVADDLQVLAISCDPMHALRGWADDKGYFFPLLSDFWPHGATATAYGVFVADKGFATRGTFLIERDGTIAYASVNAPGERRDFAGLHAAVASARG